MSRRYLTSFLWRIQTHNGTIGIHEDCLRSPYVAINPAKNLQYSLALFPNGIAGGSQERTVCLLINLKRLGLQSTGKPALTGSIAAQFDINISNGDFERTFFHIFTSDSKVLYIEICDILDEAMDEYIDDDGYITIDVTGFFIVTSEIDMSMKNLQDLSLSSELDSKLCTSLYNQKHDFTFIVGEKQVKAHKIVLRSRSDVLRSMLNGYENEVEIKDFDYEVVDTAIKLLYNFSVIKSGSLALKTLLGLLQFFDAYDIQYLKEEIENFLVEVIDQENVCCLVNASKLSNAQKLESKCIEYLVDCAIHRPLEHFDVLNEGHKNIVFSKLFKHVSSFNY